MVRPSVSPETKTGEPATPAARPFDFVERLREISMFFDGTDRVHQAMRTVAAAALAAPATVGDRFSAANVSCP